MLYRLVFSPQALTAELNMYESQSEEYKYENERLAHELQEVKKKYLAQKRKDQEFRWEIFIIYNLQYHYSCWNMFPKFEIDTLVVTTNMLLCFQFKLQY